MNVLITNLHLDHHMGTEVYVRDLSIGLQKRGFHVEVYSPELGAVADEIKNAGVHIVDSTEKLIADPDIIHAHHFGPAIEAILKFPDAPVVYFLHDRRYGADTPPKHSRVMKYVAVDYNCLDRLLLDNGIVEKDTSVLYNWVDTSRFKLRQTFAEKPARALVFSNYADERNFFPVIRDACEQEGIELDGIGARLGKVDIHPENILGSYDIVFAKAKAAMEALATGAGVIVCDLNGLAEMVNTANFSHFRKFNFGMKTQTRPIEKELIIEEISKYSAAENRRAAHLIREDASFDLTVDKILNLYRETIQAYVNEGKRPAIHDEETISDYHALKRRELRAKHENAFEKAFKVPFKKADNYLFKGALIDRLGPVYRKIFK